MSAEEDKTDWKAIAQLQSAKLSVALDEPGAMERLEKAMAACPVQQELGLFIKRLINRMHAARRGEGIAADDGELAREAIDYLDEHVYFRKKIYFRKKPSHK